MNFFDSTHFRLEALLQRRCALLESSGFTTSFKIPKPPGAVGFEEGRQVFWSPQHHQLAAVSQQRRRKESHTTLHCPKGSAEMDGYGRRRMPDERVRGSDFYDSTSNLFSRKNRQLYLAQLLSRWDWACAWSILGPAQRSSGPKQNNKRRKSPRDPLVFSIYWVHQSFEVTKKNTEGPQKRHRSM